MRTVLATIMVTLLAWSTTNFAASLVNEYRLQNGLRLLVKEDHRAPVVVSQVWYKVGSAYEPAGLTGISHALEHMMFKGTKEHGPGEFSRLVAVNGGQENAGTARDYTFYFQKIGAAKLALSFELEADRMKNLLLLPQEFAKEINVVKEERRMRIEAKPQATTYERFNATAHTSHPYHHMTAGWMEDLDHMTIEDLRDWYQKWYAPNNAIVIVIGDVTPKAVLALAKKYFGPLQAVQIPNLKSFREPKPLGTKNIEVKVPAKLPWFIMGYHVPSVKTAKAQWEPYALDVLAAVLGQGDSARLKRSLVRDQKIASQVDVSYDAFSLFSDLITIDATPAKNHTLEDVEHAVLERIHDIQHTLITDQELERIKNQVVAAHIYARDSMFYQGLRIGSVVVLNLPYTLVNEYVDHIKKVTPLQVRAVARKYLREESLTVAKLVPQVANEQGVH